ncbi:helix-turn-helix domain-containing protein [Nitrosomonas communis]|uniref:helix-turn-helix domain-containing protein n=1 Tax=Nitrosomonas communis TaxID=44574 RepID=UPI0026EEB607|nr:helix-turn-helix domain-containing protein [Nitrosomonas communis]MCO6427128.1 helix-turn-helix domain-containing protein [Nitrosomonas communis]
MNKRANRIKESARFAPSGNCTASQPIVTGQCAQVLSLIRQHGSILSFTLTADHAIPEAAARVHDLRNKGFNIITKIEQKITFRGRIRRNVARYSLGTPEWLSDSQTRRSNERKCNIHKNHENRYEKRLPRQRKT